MIYVRGAAALPLAKGELEGDSNTKFQLRKKLPLIIAFIYSISILIGISFPAYSQSDTDTLRQRFDTLEPRKYNLQDFREGFRPATRQWQNTLEDFQFYNRNILTNLYNFSTGNLGGPAFSPSLKVDTITGFRTGYNAFDVWNIANQNIALLSSNVPFTRVKYVFGSKKENYIFADHGQSFGKYVSAGFTFKRITSEGFYTNGKNTSTDFNIYVVANSRNFRYRTLTAFFTGNNKNGENGGVQNSSDAANLQSVNLSTASTVWKRTSALFSHSYSLGKMVDSLPLDSFRVKPIYSVRIGHEFEYSSQRFFFSDPNDDTTFFPVQIQDTIIRDSSQLKSYENRVFLVNENSRGFLKKWVAGAKNSILNWSNERLHNNYINTSVYGSVKLGFTKQLFLDASGQMEITGYNKGDFSVRPAVSFVFGKDSIQKASLRAGITVLNQTPAFIYSQWSSSHFKWDSLNLSKMQYFTVDAQLNLPKQRLTLNVAYKTVNNYTYLDSTIHPAQLNGLLSITEFRLHKLFRFGKWGYYATGQGQLISNTAVMPMPKVVARTGLFLEKWAFKKAMLMRVGFDVAYCDKYKYNAYHPELNQFYVSASSGNLGNQYVIDIYISARIKRSSFFFKYERLNGIWDKKPIYAVSSYPFPGGAIKFGINWIFMDYLPKKTEEKK